MYYLWYFVAFYTVVLHFFFAIYAVLSQNRFVAITGYCVEKILAKISVCACVVFYQRQGIIVDGIAICKGPSESEGTLS